MQEMRQIRLDPSKLERRGPTKIPKINKREGGGGGLLFGTGE